MTDKPKAERPALPLRCSACIEADTRKALDVMAREGMVSSEAERPQQEEK
jgi:hypothetical protein